MTATAAPAGAVGPDRRPRPSAGSTASGQRLCQDAPRLAPGADHRVRPDRRLPALERRRVRRGLRDASSRGSSCKALVDALPPAMAGVYGNPFPTAIETLGGSIAWKTARVARPDGRAVVRPRAVGDARRRGPPRQPRVRRHDAARHAPDRAREARRAPHGHGDRRARHGRLHLRRRARSATLPGRRDPVDRRRSGSPCGSASSRCLGVGRLRARAVRRSRRVGGDRRRDPRLFGYFANGYQDAAPAFAPFANLTWWGWTVHHQPLVDEFDWASLVPAVVADGRAVRGRASSPSRAATWARSQRIPWPRMPVVRARPRRAVRALAGRAAAARVLVGDRHRPAGLRVRRRRAVVQQDAAGPLARHARDLQGGLPAHRPPVGRRGVPPARVHHLRAHPRRASPRRRSSSGWASDETDGRLELLLSTPMSRAPLGAPRRPRPVRGDRRHDARDHGRDRDRVGERRRLRRRPRRSSGRSSWACTRSRWPGSGSRSAACSRPRSPARSSPCS